MSFLAALAALVVGTGGMALEPLSTAQGGDLLAQLRGLQLQDQDGRPLKLAHLHGHPVLIHFIDSGCSSTCLTQVRGLVDLLHVMPPPLRDRVRVLSISIDPRQDTPAVLKTLAGRMGAELPGWTFATGRPRETERLVQGLRLLRSDGQARRPDDRESALWLMDGQGEARMRYPGDPPDLARLVRDLSALDGRAGAPST